MGLVWTKELGSHVDATPLASAVVEVLSVGLVATDDQSSPVLYHEIEMIAGGSRIEIFRRKTASWIWSRDSYSLR